MSMEPVIDGAALRRLREVRGWDQSALARRAGISQSVVSRLERGLQDNLDAAVLIALARTLGIAVDALLVASTQPDQAPLVGELAVIVPELARLPEGDQRRVAAILQAYVQASGVRPSSDG